MPNQLNVSLVNTTNSAVYATISGRDKNGAICLIQSDGKTLYYPASPASPQTPLSANCAIPLGPPGSTILITIPQISAARVYFSIETPLVFLLNPGPGLVEPSITNPADPNTNILWGFCELTFNADQIYANISYVDFVALPIALSLTNESGAVQVVEGLPKDGLAQVCNELKSQTASDGRGWDQLIVKSKSGQILRALSPNQGSVVNPSLFTGYFEPYVDAVWNKYINTALTVDSQSQFGTVQGNVVGNVFTFPNLGTFTKPSTADIFTCSTGSFRTDTAGLAALTPRLSAAFNRSTLLSQTIQPSDVETYYQYPITNHYSRIVHSVNIDERGYAFPYDDVAPNGGVDQSGSVFDPNPTLLAITVGGPTSNSGGSGGSNFNASTNIKAASYTSENGVLTESTSDTDGGKNVGWIANGDWIGFKNVDFGSGKNLFFARVSSGAGTGISGAVQLVIDDLASAPIAIFDIANTGGWQSWVTINEPMATKLTGIHTVYITFASGQPADFVNINWFTFQLNPPAAATIASPVFTMHAVSTPAIVASAVTPSITPAVAKAAVTSSSTTGPAVTAPAATTPAATTPAVTTAKSTAAAATPPTKASKPSLFQRIFRRPKFLSKKK
jgi:hypothetical protein